MSPINLAGFLLITGTLIFWLGALLPTWQVYVTRDPQVRVQLITRLRRFWVLSHLLFMAGATTTAVGLGVVASTVEPPGARSIAIAGLATIVLATLAFAYSCLRDPA